MISYVTIAKGFLVLGTIAAVVGLLGGLILGFAWIRHQWLHHWHSSSSGRKAGTTGT